MSRDEALALAAAAEEVPKGTRRRSGDRRGMRDGGLKPEKLGFVLCLLLCLYAYTLLINLSIIIINYYYSLLILVLLLLFYFVWKYIYNIHKHLIICVYARLGMYKHSNHSINGACGKLVSISQTKLGKAGGTSSYLLANPITKEPKDTHEPRNWIRFDHCQSGTIRC